MRRIEIDMMESFEFTYNQGLNNIVIYAPDIETAIYHFYHDSMCLEEPKLKITNIKFHNRLMTCGKSILKNK